MLMWSGSLVVNIELLNWLEQGHSVRSESFLHSSPPFLTILQALHMLATMSSLVKKLPLSWSLDLHHISILKMNVQYTMTSVWSALEFRSSGGLAQSMATQLWCLVCSDHLWKVFSLKTSIVSRSGLLRQLRDNWYANTFSLSQYIDLAGIDFLHWADPQTSYYSQRLKARQYLDRTWLAQVYRPCHRFWPCKALPRSADAHPYPNPRQLSLDWIDSICVHQCPSGHWVISSGWHRITCIYPHIFNAWFTSLAGQTGW